MALIAKVSTDEMKEIAARICRDYLTGSWKTISAEDIKFKRISGGLSNFLFYVSLPDVCDSHPPSPVPDQLMKITKRVRKDSGNSLIEPPKEVLLRIYGQTHGEHALETMLTESVVFALLSERNLGPKLHGIFPGGRIEQYIPARALATSELSDYRISMRIAEKMAEIHSLDIPVSKEPDWLWKSIARWLKTAEDVLEEVCNGAENQNGHLIAEVKQTNFRQEVAWLKSLIEAEDYPVMFCHNDLQEGNILLKEERSSRENSIDSLSNEFEESMTSFESDYGEDVVTSSRENDKNISGVVSGNRRKRPLQRVNSVSSDLDSTRDSVISNTSEDCDPELSIIDYEYCAYNYRGFDLANHFLEWTLDYTNSEYPYYFHRKSQYPTKQQRHEFIAAYLKRLSAFDCENAIPSQQDIDEVEDEVRVFSMVSHLFWTLWSVVNVHQNIEFGYWEYAITRLREYQLAKASFLSHCNENKIN